MNDPSSMRRPWLNRSRAALLLLAVAVPAGVLAVACSVPERAPPAPKSGACTEGCVDLIDASVDGPTADAAQIGPDAGLDPGSRNPKCGAPDDCNPDPDDAVWSCGGSIVQQTSVPSALPSPSGVIPDPTKLGFPAQGSPTSSGAPFERPILACQVVHEKEQPRATCVRAGKAREGEACRGVRSDGTVEQADCAPGLACVFRDGNTDANAGECRPYCCYGAKQCDVGSWCAPKYLFEQNSPDSPPLVPVCAAADNCPLLEPGVCPVGLACVLVADRTTSCFLPGKGKSGEPCSCAEGFACSGVSNTCRAICRLGLEGACGQGLCVGGGGALPDGFGLCIDP